MERKGESMKKAMQFIRCTMGAFVGVFIGRLASVIWEHNSNPERYAVQSAPWYTEILFHAVFTLAVLFVCAVIIWILKRINRKNDQQLG